MLKVCKMYQLLPQMLAMFGVFWSSCSASDDTLVVDTAAGSVRGRLQNVIHGLSVKQFLGIPYAQPPVGQLRFARPQPAIPWNGIRDAVKFGPTCPQITRGPSPQSEDCLSLNVYTPSQTTPQDKLAVMVWIHGGGYTFGSGLLYDPSVLAAYNNVIAITINYRLGVLGFFNIPGTDIKGNYGMHDQILALKWVQQNIANFGGDPNKVTIFGESAGGMSVSHHLISPLSKGLFQRVIAQSGSSASPFTGAWVKSNEMAKTFSKAIGCDFDNELMSCLRIKSWSNFVKAQKNISYPANMRIQPLCTVVVDGEFLTDDPRKLLNQGQVNQAHVMIGVTTNEGAIVNINHGVGIYKDGADPKDVENVIKHGFQLHPNQNQIIEEATYFEYIDQSDLNNRIKHRQAMIDVGSDCAFFAPAVLEAKALAKANVSVYFYLFDHFPHYCSFPKYVGSFHFVDVLFCFGVAVNMESGFEHLKAVFQTSRFSDLEVGLALYTMRLWTTFAKYGDPNAGETMPLVTWPRYNSSAHVHLRISLNPKLEYSFRERKIAFWNEFIHNLAEGEAQKESGSKKTKEDQPAKEEL